ncbi:hypothetical protein FXO38_28496 [Capsicum annuum]|nr:hypothetical protein FXO38_28496 [Capsicum annuum]KAF3630009.1 hypothetical protein FXO37_28657 [Capsicum annuum]
MPKSRSLLTYTEQTQLEKILVREVIIDISATIIHRGLFRPDYVALISIEECDYRLRVICGRHIIHDVENRRERVKIVRWIDNYISLLGDNTLGLRGRCELCERDFSEATTLLFPYFVQRLCDDARVPKSEGPIPIEPIDKHRGDMGVSMEFDMTEQREAPELSTQGEGTPATSILALAFTLESVGTSLVPHRPSTSAVASGMMFVSSEFLQSLVDSQSITNIPLQNVKDEVVTLYGQIQPWVWTTLKIVEATLESVHWATMSEL